MARQSGTRRGAKKPEDATQTAQDVGDPPNNIPSDVAQETAPAPEATTNPDPDPTPPPPTTGEADAAAATPPAPEQEPEPAPQAGQTTPAPPSDTDDRSAQTRAPRRGGFVPMLLGGALAAGLGAGAALYLYPEGLGHSGPADAELAALEARVMQALAEMEARLPADPAPEFANLSSRLAALETAAPGTEAQARELGAQLESLEGRLLSLQPPADLDASVQAAAEAAIEAALELRIDAAISAALGETLSAQDDRAAEIEAAEAQLARNRALIERRSALAELTAAAQTGASAPEALERLSALGVETGGLVALSGGLATLAMLQTGFAPAARAALAAAPLPDTDDPVGRLTGFLRGLTNARSLAPREGDDTDAILSRAEALLRLGDLDGAIAEIDTLPEGPAMAMAEWRTMAATRRDTLAALASVMAQE